MKTNKKGNIYPVIKVNIALKKNIILIVATAIIIFCTHKIPRTANVLILLLYKRNSMLNTVCYGSIITF